MSVHYFNVFIFLTICIIVNYCLAVGCKNRAKKVLAYLSFYFHIKTHRDLTNGFMPLEERTGNHQHIVVYVVINLKKSVFVVRKLIQNAVPTIFPMFLTYNQKPMNTGRQKSP